MAVLSSGIADCGEGMTAKPAMVAAGSWRPSRSRKDGESCQGETDVGDVARVVEVADRQSDVIERRQRIAVFGLKPRQRGRQQWFGQAAAAVLGDHQAPAQGLQRAVGISIAEGVAIGVERVGERPRVVGGLGGVDQPVRGGPRLLTGTRPSSVR